MAERERKFYIDIVRIIPEWFAGVVGLVYITGFIVVLTFLNSFGIRESGEEFLRAKYIHVGAFCIMFPALIVSPIIAFVVFFMSMDGNQSGNVLIINLVRVMRNRHIGIFKRIGFALDCISQWISCKREAFVIIPSLFFVVNMPFLFCGIAAFAYPGYFQLVIKRVAWLISITLFGAIIITEVGDKVLGPFSRFVARLILLGVVVLFDVTQFDKIVGIMLDVFLRGGWVFVVFQFLIAYIPPRFYIRAKRFPGIANQVAYISVGITMLVVFYYLSVLSFAFRVYPYIPVVKGGGDYEYSPLVALGVDEKSKGMVPKALFRSRKPTSITMPLVIIEETRNSIFVADPCSDWGPEKWRGKRRPTIYRIGRDSVISISYPKTPAEWAAELNDSVEVPRIVKQESSQKRKMQ